MRKICLLILSVILVLNLCACGNSTPSAEAPTTGAKNVATTGSSASKPESTEMTETLAETTEEPTVETTEAPLVPQGKVEIDTDSVPTKWTLKDLGPVEDGEGTLTFRSDDLLVRYEKDENDNTLYIPVDHMGKQLSSDRYGYFDELLPGLFTVSSLEDTINNTGLMTEAGEMLLPCECAIINELSFRESENAKPRFLRVIYATEETDNKDEAFFYSTDSAFSFQPQEGDKFYKGYAKIYDLENKRFVSDLTITNPDKFDTMVGGGLIYVETLNDEQIVYNADGKELFKTTEYVNIELGEGFYVVDYREVYNTEGQLLFKLDDYDSMQIISGTARFLSKCDYDTKTLTVYDFYGNQVFEVEGPTLVNFEAGGLFATTIDERAVLYDATGKVVYSMDNCYTPSYKGHGIWEFSPVDSEANSKYYLVNGTEVAGTQRYVYELVNEIKKEGSESFTFCPWNKPTEEISVTASYTSSLVDGLVCAHGKPCSLVDCFSGETLMTADSFEFADSNYIYAKVDGEYHVYELVLE